MDYIQDSGYIKASFFSDYKLMDIWSIDYMHWWDPLYGLFKWFN